MVEKTENKKDRTWFQQITDFSDWTKTTWFYVGIFLVLILLTIYLFYKLYVDPEFLFGLVVNYFVVPVIEMGAGGWILFIVFMGIQSVAVPIPSEIVLLSSGLLWGPVGGFILSMIGCFITGTMAYYISRKGGRPIVEKFIGKHNIELVDYYIEKYGSPVIAILRAIPIMAFDPVSYVSGLVKISYKKYITATMIGSVVRSIFWAWLGSTLIPNTITLQDLASDPALIDKFVGEGAEQFNVILFIILGVLAAGFLLYSFVLAPYMRKRRNIEVAKLEQTKTTSTEENPAAGVIPQLKDSPPK